MIDIYQMPSKSKNEIMDITREKDNWSGSEVRMLINKVKGSIGNFIVNEIKIGDILASNFMVHPAVVISVKKDKIHAVIMTTEVTCPSIIMKANSRLYKGNYFTSSIVVYNKEEEYNIPGCYDNKKDIIELRKKLKLHYKNLFRL